MVSVLATWMVADVSLVLRMMSRCNTNSTREEGGRSDPVTMDLLGGGGSKSIEEEEGEINLRVTAGWEKGIDLSVKLCSIHIHRFCFQLIAIKTSDRSSIRFCITV